MIDLPEIDCVIVAYNSAEDLPDSVGSVQRQVGVRTNVTVVDNASADDSAAVARELGVQVIENGSNRGFAVAVNAGLRAGTAPWVLIFNPDAALPEDGLARLVATAESVDSCGCVGPRIANLDGTEYASGRRFPDLWTAAAHALLGRLAPGNPATRRYHARDIDRTKTTAVDWVSGCCMVLRRSTWESLGGLDESYFMYLEDVDLCFRLKQAGQVTVYEPAVSVPHIGGRSSRSKRLATIYYHHASALRFYRRANTTPLGRSLLPLAALVLAARGALLSVGPALRLAGRKLHLASRNP